MSAATVTLGADALSFERVGRTFARADEIVSAGRVDLAQATQVDSAGVSLLLELARRAQRKGQKLEFVNTPPQLRGLLVFFGVDSLLGI